MSTLSRPNTACTVNNKGAASATGRTVYRQDRLIVIIRRGRLWVRWLYQRFLTSEALVAITNPACCHRYRLGVEPGPPGEPFRQLGAIRSRGWEMERLWRSPKLIPSKGSKNGWVFCLMIDACVC